MKKILVITLFLLLFAPDAWGTDFTVKTSGGDYSNIITCMNAISAGDRCVVYPGTFSGGSITTSGSSNTVRKVLIADTAGAQPVISSAVNVTNESYITISGFEFSGMGGGQAVSGNGCSYITIHNNDINNTDIGISTSGGGIDCDNILIDGNRFIEDRGDDIVKGTGSRWVVRNNIATDINDSQDEHIDFFQVHSCSIFTTSYILIENNLYADITGNNTHYFLGNCASGSATNYIIRYNKVRNVGGYEFTMFDGNGTPFTGVAVYNNTYKDLDSDGSHQSWQDYNIVLSSAASRMSANNISIDSADRSGLEVVSPPSSGCNGTLAYESGGSISADGCLSSCVGAGNCIINDNPDLTDVENNDFSLQAGSPAIDAGHNLTAVATADTGSGTSLVVNNPYPFQDGWAGIDPDWIAVGNVANVVRISSINYSTDTITLASSISRNDGDEVWLYKKSDGAIVLLGSAPDIGAEEFIVAAEESSGASFTGTMRGTFR